MINENLYLHIYLNEKYRGKETLSPLNSFQTLVETIWSKFSLADFDQSIALFIIQNNSIQQEFQISPNQFRYEVKELNIISGGSLYIYVSFFFQFFYINQFALEKENVKITVFDKSKLKIASNPKIKIIPANNQMRGTSKFCMMQNHHNEELKYFCFNKACNMYMKLCCSDCLQDFHYTHVQECLKIDMLVNYSQQLAESMKQQELNFTKSTNILKNQYEEMKNQLKRKFNVVWDSITQQMTRVTEYYQELAQVIKLLEEKKFILLNQSQIYLLEQFYDKKLHFLDEKQKSITVHQKEAERLIQTITQNVEKQFAQSQLIQSNSNSNSNEKKQHKSMLGEIIRGASILSKQVSLQFMQKDNQDIKISTLYLKKYQKVLTIKYPYELKNYDDKVIDMLKNINMQTRFWNFKIYIKYSCDFSEIFLIDDQNKKYLYCCI